MSAIPLSAFGPGRQLPPSEPCLFLAWDSDFFGRRIARANSSRLTEESARCILDWCGSNNIDCVYLLADADHDETIRVAEEHSFHLVDIRVTMEFPLGRAVPRADSTPSASVRGFREADLTGLRSIARGNYRSTRFHYDRHFAPERADRLYELWIEKSCSGFADQVFVADLDGTPAGFLSCHLDANASGHIGLVGVRSEVCGLGIGQALLGSSLRWFGERGVDHVRVVTQGRNVSAQRLYQRCGFLTHSVRLWFHRWFLLGSD